MKMDKNASESSEHGRDANDDKNSGDFSGNYVRRRKCNENVQICEKKKKRETFRRISLVLRKNEALRSTDEKKQLESNPDVVRQILKRREHLANTKERVLEKEDPADVIETKAKKLAEVLSRAQHLVCYTGAGISTSARIPDYRGSQGIWTLLQQGKEIGQHDLSLAEPTFTHMALFELHRRNILRYTLSQNCDGLHLRSGLPRKSLSEIHGNMYIEVCKLCKPNVEYWRLFDTTELTARFNHKTNRRCHFCLKPLCDTIVHFGERGSLKWPLNWDGACKNSDKADVILCLGSSLKVLKKYSWLWSMDRPKNKRPKIYIVNLQWTPKDKNASLKINGKCDEVMKLVMDYMNIKVSPYNRMKDPIFAHACLLTTEELHTVSQPMLKHHTDENAWRQNGTQTTETESTKFESEQKEIDDKTEAEQVTQSPPIKTEFVNENESSQSKIICEPNEAKKTTKEENKVEVSSVNAAHDQKANGTTVSLSQLCGMSKIEEKTNNRILDGDDKSSEEKTVIAQIETSSSASFNQVDCKLNVAKNENFLKELPSLISLKTDVDLSMPNNCRDRLGCSENQERLFNIQQRLGQLLVMKQKNFLLHHKTTTADRYLLNSFRETETEPLRAQSVALTDALAAAAAKVVAMKATQAESARTDMGFSSNSIALGNEAIDDKDCYQSLVNYYRAIEGVLPHWYDVNYAYSGLHSIIHPPPTEVDIWGSIIIPIFQLNRNIAECEFCFDNYAEDHCQFYRPSQKFVMEPNRRNGRLVFCECCDHSDNDEGNEENQNDLDDDEMGTDTKANSDDGDFKDNAKRTKLDELKEAPKIQPGWYGKGCRKNIRRKKRRQHQLP